MIDVDLSLVHELDEYLDVGKFDVTHDDDWIFFLVLRQDTIEVRTARRQDDLRNNNKKKTRGDIKVYHSNVTQDRCKPSRDYTTLFLYISLLFRIFFFFNLFRNQCFISAVGAIDCIEAVFFVFYLAAFIFIISD